MADSACYVGFHGEKQQRSQIRLVQGIGIKEEKEEGEREREGMCSDREGRWWRDDEDNSLPGILEGVDLLGDGHEWTDGQMDGWEDESDNLSV